MRDLTQLAEAQERIGTRVTVSAQMEGVSAGMTVTTNHAEDGFELLADVLQHPAFHDSDFERLRRQRLVAIAQESDSPTAIAIRVGPMLLYGDHPYGASSTGTVESIKALTRNDLTSFYAKYYGPTNSVLAVVGDVSLTEARRLGEKYFGTWTGATAAGVVIPPPPPAPARHIVIVDKPGAPQTALFAFGFGLAGSTPDLQALQIMNYTLGGSFASRINMNLREDHGYTYGANSQYVFYPQGGNFVAGGLVRTDITGLAAKELIGEISRFPSAPPTDAELKMARDARIQSIPALFETTSATAGAVASLYFYNRPLDYYTTLPDKYRRVTAEDVTRVAKIDVHPDNLIIVAVGDRAKIESGLKDAQLGPIEVRTPTGELAQ